MLPNCIINGVAKSGTSSVYQYLNAHYQVFMSDPKELNYFAYSKDRLELGLTNKFPVRTLEEYEKHFKDGEHYKIRGEASPLYFNMPGTASRIKAVVPDVRFITTLRNPVDRAYSGYLMQLRKSRVREKDIAKNFTSDKHWVQLGLYFDRLIEFYDQFDASQIKIVLLEDMKSDKESVLKDIFNFLEIEDNYNYESTSSHNVGHVPKNAVANNIFRNNSFVNKVVKPIVPKKIKNLLRSIERVNQTKPKPLSEELRMELNSLYREDIEKVQDLIDRDLSFWRERG